MTREEAIKILLGYSYTPEERAALETLVPELAESEDERMYKAISIALSLDEAKGYLRTWDITPKDADAWLEKQKESTWTEEDENFVKHILPRILNPSGWTLEQNTADKEHLQEFIDRQKSKFTEKQKESLHISETCKENADSFTDKDEKIRRTLVEYFGPQVQLDFIRGVPIQKIRDWLEKQKEQKPTDEAEDFFDSAESYHQGFIAGKKKMKEDIEKGFGLSIGEHSLDYLVGRFAGYETAKAEQRFEEAREKYQVEWSEEDEENIKSICARLDSLLYIEDMVEKTNIVGEISWLKSLKNRGNSPKSNTNSLSWSEEDIDKMVNERARKSGTTKTEMHFYRQGIEDTLKNLRPSWKPSEEQIKALEKAIIRAHSDDEIPILTELRQQLKKLM